MICRNTFTHVVMLCSFFFIYTELSNSNKLKCFIFKVPVPDIVNFVIDEHIKNKHYSEEQKSLYQVLRNIMTYTRPFQHYVYHNENIVDIKFLKKMRIFDYNNEESLFTNFINTIDSRMSHTGQLARCLIMCFPNTNLQVLTDRQKVIRVLSTDSAQQLYESLDAYKRIEKDFIALFGDDRDIDTLSYDEILGKLQVLQKIILLLQDINTTISSNAKLKKVLLKHTKSFRVIFNRYLVGDKFYDIMYYLVKKRIVRRLLFRNNGFNKKILMTFKNYEQLFFSIVHELGNMEILMNIAKAVDNDKKRLTTVTFLDRTLKSTPYVNIDKMTNYIDESVMSSNNISFKVPQSGLYSIVVPSTATPENICHVKNVFLNVYMGQIFGISFSKKCVLTPFNKISTSKLNTQTVI